MTIWLGLLKLNNSSKRIWYHSSKKIKVFLGIELFHSKNGLFMSQRRYVLDLLKDTGKMVAKHNTHVDYNCNLNFTDGKFVDDIGQFQRLVGKLIYLTITRHDITYVMSCVSQFMHALMTSHMNVVDRI